MSQMWVIYLLSFVQRDFLSPVYLSDDTDTPNVELIKRSL